jgi:hypothetical protein
MIFGPSCALLLPGSQTGFSGPFIEPINRANTSSQSITRGRVVLTEFTPKRYGRIRAPKERPTRLVGQLALIVTSIVVLLSGCAPVEDKAPTIYRLPWLDASGTYSIQDISLTTFHEPDKLRGAAGEVVVDPRVNGDSIEANEPIGRWVRDGSVMRPADFVTQQAATLYAHLEKLSEIDTATGVASKLNGISRIGMLVRISESTSSPMILNNAVYDGRLDALFIVPYAGDLLPISQNAGIIGHEHFHRVFQAIVLSSIREKERTKAVPYRVGYEAPCAGGVVDKLAGDREPDATGWGGGLVPIHIMNRALLRGVNEGFADFWGWAYSRDEEFVARSLGIREDAERRLDKLAGALPQKMGFRKSLTTLDKQGKPTLKSEDSRIAASYRIGTEYARVLRGVVEALVSSGGFTRIAATEKVRLALAQSLVTLSTEVAAGWVREELDPELMMKPFFTKLIRMSQAGPAVLESASAVVVCDELARLQASSHMLDGLCVSKVTLNVPGLRN